VANIVARIQETTNVSDWKRVPTWENLADFISLGVTQKKLENMQLCWYGPQWLQQSATSRPSLREEEMIDDLPEERKTR